MQANQRYLGRKLSGTFISDWLVKSWDDDKWAQEMTAIQEIGMEYLVLAPSLLQKQDGSWYVNYPTELTDAKKSYDGIDVIEALLRNAQRFGMKVFLGLNMHEKWWENWWDIQTTLKNSNWLYDQMRIGNTVADELYQRYHTKYPETFYGWYWVWEFWNSKAMALNTAGRNQSIDILASCLNINLDHLTNISPSMPLMFSPFANMCITTYDDLYYMWKDIMKTTHFRKGDIFCPQDSVGAGGTKMSELRNCYATYKKVCNEVEGLRFWANNENFDHKDWSSASLDRFVKQLEITGEYSEKNITFSYNNYYSPVNIGYGFHNAFKQYLCAGKLSNEMPSAPTCLKRTESKKGILLEWDPCVNAAGYSVYKNNKLIGSLKCGRDDGMGSIPEIPCRYFDIKGSIKDKYGIVSFNYEGNYSYICTSNLK